MPNPPAAVTAAASRPPATPPMGASRIGWSMPRSWVSAVAIATALLGGHQLLRHAWHVGEAVGDVLGKGLGRRARSAGLAGEADIECAGRGEAVTLGQYAHARPDAELRHGADREAGHHGRIDGIG